VNFSSQMGYDFVVYNGIVDPYAPDLHSTEFPIRVSRHNGYIFSEIGYEYSQYHIAEELDEVIDTLVGKLMATPRELTSEEKVELYEKAKQTIELDAEYNGVELSELEQADQVDREFKKELANLELDAEAAEADKKKIREAIAVFSLIAAIVPVTVCYN
jgi:hypothetical protein